MRPLVRLVDAGKILKLARERALVESFWVAGDTLFKRCIDERLDELTLVDHLPYHLTLGAERGNEGTGQDKPRLRHQLGDFADSADVFHTVGMSEAKIFVQPVAQIIAIE